jgi:hypothetical protein
MFFPALENFALSWEKVWGRPCVLELVINCPYLVKGCIFTMLYCIFLLSFLTFPKWTRQVCFQFGKNKLFKNRKIAMVHLELQNTLKLGYNEHGYYDHSVIKNSRLLGTLGYKEFSVIRNTRL